MPATDEDEQRLVPVEDLATRRVLWHSVWDWIIQHCEELASQGESGDSPTGEVPEDVNELARR